MKLTICLDIDEIFRVSQIVPVRSSAGGALGRAIYMCGSHWSSGNRDIVVECDDTEARDLLCYAESSCPSAADKIRQAL
jgi:hypothetical protein